MTPIYLDIADSCNNHKDIAKSLQMGQRKVNGEIL